MLTPPTSYNINKYLSDPYKYLYRLLIQFIKKNKADRRWQAGFAASVIFIALALMLSFHFIHNSRNYKLSQNEQILLSQSSVKAEKITEDENTITYNQEAGKDKDNANVVLSSANSASVAFPYSATLAKTGDQSLEFGNSDGKLSFKLIPSHPLIEGKNHNGHIIYPANYQQRQVYTFKRNGVKSDILLSKAPADSISYSWKIELPAELEAKKLANGSIGIYSAPSYLYNNLQISDAKSQQLIDNARKNGNKDTLVFVLPAPFIQESSEKAGEPTPAPNYKDAYYELSGNNLTLRLKNLNDKNYPLTIDPSVVVTTTAEFQSGYYDDGMINYSTSGQIGRSPVSLGTIGTWNYTYNGSSCATWAGACTTGFTQARQSHTSVAYNGYLYVIGGRSDTNNNDCTATSNYCNGTQYTAINSDGTIGTWKYTYNGNSCATWAGSCTTGFTEARINHSSVIYNGYLYVIGGESPSSSSDCTTSVNNRCNGTQYAPINADGTIGTWNYTYNGNSCATWAGSCTTGFTVGRQNHTSVVYNGYLYVIGGLSGTTASDCNSTCNGTQYAPINADGTIGTWNYTYNGSSCATWASPCNTGFTEVRQGHTSVVYNGYLYVIGGQSISGAGSDCTASSNYCNGTQYAPINADGTIGTWNYTYNGNSCATWASPCNTGFTLARFNASSVSYNGSLYVMGGASNTSTQDCTSIAGFECSGVQFTPINANGTIGTWNYTHSSANDGTTFSNGFTHRRFKSTAVFYNNYLYVVGGGTITAGDDCSASACNGTQISLIDTGTPSFGTLGTRAQQTSAFTTPRYGHTSAVYNGYLYIIGGGANASATGCNATGFCNDIIHCPLNTDGSVGSCTQQTSAFTTPRSNHTSTVWNGYLYIVGGFADASATGCDNAGRCNDIQYCPINSSTGAVGACTQQTSAFTTARYSHTSAVYNGYLYIVGGNAAASATGCDSSSRCNDIQYCPINSSTGAVGACTQHTSAFTTARYSHTSAVYNGYLYIVGGLAAASATGCDGGGYCSDIIHCVINANGSIGTCTQQTSAFDTPRYGHTLATYNQYLYISGGLGGLSGNCAGNFCNNTNRCPINVNGSAGTCIQDANAFISARYLHTEVAFNGYLYVIGGTSTASATGCNTSGYCNDIQYLPIKSPAQQARYERIINTGTADTITNIMFNGQAVCGASILYAAAGSDGVFGSRSVIPGALPGVTYTVNAVAKKYLKLIVVLNDQDCGTNSYVSDITVNYNSPASIPTLVNPAASESNTSISPIFKLRSTDTNDDYVQYHVKIYSSQTECNTDSATNLVRSVDQSSSQTGWSGQDANSSNAYVGATLIENSTMGTYFYQAPPLAPGSTYWWKGRSIDSAGTANWSSWTTCQSFTIGASEVRIQGGLNIRGGTNIR